MRRPSTLLVLTGALVITGLVMAFGSLDLDDQGVEVDHWIHCLQGPPLPGSGLQQQLSDLQVQHAQLQGEEEKPRRLGRLDVRHLPLQTMASRILRSNGITPTPQMPHGAASPSLPDDESSKGVALLARRPGSCLGGASPISNSSALKKKTEARAEVKADCPAVRAANADALLKPPRRRCCGRPRQPVSSRSRTLATRFRRFPSSRFRRHRWASAQ